MCDDLRLQGFDPISRRAPLFEQSCEHPACSLRELLVRLHQRRQFLKPAQAPRNDEAKLGRQATHRVGQHGLLLDEQGAS
jgi:hypothetical protein